MVDDELTAHIQALRRYALSLTGDPYDADDLVQETLRRAIDYGGGRPRVQNWSAYLFRILRNVHNDQMKRRLRQPAPISLDDDSARDIGCAPTQDGVVERASVQAALRRLPEAQCRVVLLTGLLGYSYREVAVLLGIPVGTVMSRLSRGRQLLRAAFDR